MTIEEVLINHLKSLGADCLCNEDCGCGIDDLSPEGCLILDSCVSAKKTTRTDNEKCNKCDSVDIGEECFCPL